MFKIDFLRKQVGDLLADNQNSPLFVGMKKRFADHSIWKLGREALRPQFCLALLFALANSKGVSPQSEPTDEQELFVLVGSKRIYQLYEEDSCRDPTERARKVEQNRKKRISSEWKIARTIAKRRYPGRWNMLKVRLYQRELVRELRKQSDVKWQIRIRDLFYGEHETPPQMLEQRAA